MLRKLLKYEVKATARIFLPLYAVFLIYSVIHTVISRLYPNKIGIPEAISTFIYVMLFAGIFVMTLIIIIQRLYKNLLSDEGYLMFTLPTRPWQHITSKLLVSMLWIAASAVIATLSICIITYNRVFTEAFIRDITDSFKFFFNEYGAMSAVLILEGLALAVIALIANVLLIYAAIALGHLFSRHRILAALGSYIALSTITQIVVAILGVIGSKIPFPGQEHISSAYDPYVHLFIVSLIILGGLLSAGYFAITNHILDKKLNLE